MYLGICLMEYLYALSGLRFGGIFYEAYLINYFGSYLRNFSIGFNVLESFKGKWKEWSYSCTYKHAKGIIQDKHETCSLQVKG